MAVTKGQAVWYGIHMLALAFLTIIRHRMALGQVQKNDEADLLLRVIPLSVPEIRRLLVRLVWAIRTLPEQILACSLWPRTNKLVPKLLTTVAVILF